MSADYTEMHSGRAKVGRCPSCKCPLFADLTLESTLGKPYWISAAVGGEERVAVNSSVKVVGMRLQHACGTASESCDAYSGESGR